MGWRQDLLLILRLVRFGCRSAAPGLRRSERITGPGVQPCNGPLKGPFFSPESLGHGAQPTESKTGAPALVRQLLIQRVGCFDPKPFDPKPFDPKPPEHRDRGLRQGPAEHRASDASRHPWSRQANLLPQAACSWLAGVGGVRLAGSIEAGCLLYHHSCRAGARRCGNRVITVRVGRAPGCSSSTA